MIGSSLSKHFPCLQLVKMCTLSLLGKNKLQHLTYEAIDVLTDCSLTLMTYHGVVLLLAGYQADEAHIVKQYKAIVDK